MPSEDTDSRLSVDSAAALIGAPPPEDEKKDSTGVPSPESGDGQEAPATVPDSGEGESTETAAEGSEPEILPAIEPPLSWDADSKAKFGELPRDLQEHIAEREKERDTATSKALQEAAERRKATEETSARLTQLTQTLEAILPQAVETFRGRWANVDWNKLVDTIGTEETFKLKTQYELEEKQLAYMANAHRAANDTRYAEFVRTEMAKLPEYVPELADVKEGQKRQAHLVQFLLDEGYTQQQISGIDARQARTAWESMQYRQAKKGLSQAKTKPAPAAQAKPSVSASASSPQNKTLQRLNAKFEKTGRWSVDDAVAALNTRE
jgi:hypothetical protein